MNRREANQQTDDTLQEHIGETSLAKTVICLPTTNEAEAYEWWNRKQGPWIDPIEDPQPERDKI